MHSAASSASSVVAHHGRTASATAAPSSALALAQLVRALAFVLACALALAEFPRPTRPELLPLPGHEA